MVIDNEILITSQGLQRELKRICKLVGIRYLPPHQIFFSDVTLLAMESENVLDIQRRMGHTDPRTSNGYICDAAKYVVASGPSLLFKE